MIEAVPEDQALKEEVLERVGAAAPPEAIVATNTSSLPIAGLAGAIARPARFLGVHWFNPPEWTPGIEVIAGPDTSRAVVERVLGFMRAVGKRPAEVGDRAAFVSNRLQMALMREALACVEEGLVTREDLDEVVRSTFGFRLPFFGPFLIADMAGLDTYASVFRTLEREVGPAFAVPGALQELVDAGRVGTKSGEGSAPTPRPTATRSCSSATAATPRWARCWRTCRRPAWTRRRTGRRRNRRARSPTAAGGAPQARATPPRLRRTRSRARNRRAGDRRSRGESRVDDH